MENFNRVKEVMGDSFDDQTIIRALNINQNDFERAINYLLEPPINSEPTKQQHSQNQNQNQNQQQQQEQLLRQSLSHAFTSTHSSQWPSNSSSWTQVLPDHPPPIDNLIQPLLDPSVEAREPLVLPNSPPKGSYQPLTVTGQTTPTEEFRMTDQQPFRISPLQPSQNTSTTGHPGQAGGLDSTAEIQLIDETPDKRFQAELDAAIQASLASDSQLSALSNPPLDNKDIPSEDEQMSKALEESLAMSGSRTLEADGKFSHPPPNHRLRQAGAPTALRVHNPHLVFLPCLLSAMYAAKPFRDRILGFQPDPKFVNQGLIDHDFQGLWNGKSSWRSGEQWPDKPQSAEIILAIQRLFTMMTHTNRSYLDVQEISLLLGYEGGESISWSLNEPNKGCHRTYETVAEAWRELSWEIFKSNHPDVDQQESQHKLLSEFEVEQRLFHWKGHQLPLPLPEDEPTESPLMPATDNSTTSLTLNTLDSTLNDIYSCIDAQVWLSESNQAHFLNGTSEVIAFEIDRKSSCSSSWGSSSSNINHSEFASIDLTKAPFKLEPLFWVDRYLIQNRHKIAELREEISRIEGEADVSLARRTQLSTAGDKDLLSTLKATIDYLSTSSQFPTPDGVQREKTRKEMLPKFQESLKRLEAELASLDEKATTALAAAKGVFEVEEMKQIGPHELSAVVVSDGFSGREHMWTYVKTDDGRWFKSFDQSVTEVSLHSVLSDPAGIHMNSGHIFAIYVHKPPPDRPTIESQDIKMPACFEQSIMKDNELLQAETLESTVLGPPGYREGGMVEDVEMTTDSPRSDVADAGGPIELDLLAPEDELGFEIGPPIRLQGGAREPRPPSDDDDGEEEEEEADDLVELGFLKKINRPLVPTAITGKVGGAPIWLDPACPLDPESTVCAGCNQPMKFLLQMNAPDDTNPAAYYRALYVFICVEPRCWADRSTGAADGPSQSATDRRVKVFRNQLGAPHDDSHKIQRLARRPVEALSAFREWEIVCDLEPDALDQDAALLEASQLVDKMTLCELKESAKPKTTADPDANMSETKSKVDDEFLAFQTRLSRAPGQILRYLRVSEPGVGPLWVSKQTAAEAGQVAAMARCGQCGGARTAEVQVLSTLIAHLGSIDHPSLADSLDFGSLLLFTCIHSCATPPHILHPSWTQEACFVQFFSHHGLFS